MTYSIEELQAMAKKASQMAREKTFEQGLPWIYRNEDNNMVYEYKNGSKHIFAVNEENANLTLIKIIPGNQYERIYNIWGVNGSGKSTLYKGHNYSNHIYLNADDIAREIGDQNDQLVQLKAGKLFLVNLKKALFDGKSIIIETTLSGKSIKQYMELARKNNYKIIMHYILCELNTSIKRIEFRVSQGGHNIPLDVVNRRYNKSFLNLNENKYLIDEIYFYNNISQEHELIAVYNQKLVLLSGPSIWNDYLIKMFNN